MKAGPLFTFCVNAPCYLSSYGYIKVMTSFCENYTKLLDGAQLSKLINSQTLPALQRWNPPTTLDLFFNVTMDHIDRFQDETDFRIEHDYYESIRALINNGIEPHQ